MIRFVIIGIIMVAVGIILERIAKRDLKKLSENKYSGSNRALDVDLEELSQKAEKLIVAVIDSLPGDIKFEAQKVPFVVKDWPIEKEDGNVLGHYQKLGLGTSMEGGASIVIFTGSIFQHCQDTGLEFEDEVKTTYLHELGHHFGWDEEEIAKRGLA